MLSRGACTVPSRFRRRWLLIGSEGFLYVSICTTRGCLGPTEAASEPVASAARSIKLDFIVLARCSCG